VTPLFLQSHNVEAASLIDKFDEAKSERARHMMV
jgi:hypothetical protein